MKPIDTKPMIDASQTQMETGRIIMQPGEPSASSHQCGGGPHVSDFEAPNSPQVFISETRQEAQARAARYVGVRVIPYAGTETSWSELPRPVKTIGEYWAHMPA